ncbi:MAG TPA: hypothetical protein GX696_09295 [Pseudomonadaceae bacterium]|nr:hypothetical protein [Pseudomonadaceae bacterium]
MPTESRAHRLSLKVLPVGILLFVTGFLWAPSNDVLRVIFHLSFVFPLLVVWPWRSWPLERVGGMATVFALSFAALGVLSTLWGNSADLPFFIWQWLLLAAWLAGICWWQCRHGTDLRFMYHLLLGVGLLSAVSVLGVFYAQQPWSERLYGWTIAQNPVVVAQTYGVLVIIAYVLSLQSVSRRVSLAYLAAALVLMLPVLMSQSRWPVLGVVLVSGLALLLTRPPRGILLAQLPVYLLVGVAVLVLEPVRFWEARGLSFRDAIWSEVLQLSWQHPWLGAGYSAEGHIPLEVGDFHHAHNAWIDSFYWLGLAGLLLGLCHLQRVLAACRMRAEVLPLSLWFLFGCFCLLTDSRTLFWEINSKWFLYWVPAGLLVAAAYRPSYSSSGA